MFIMPDQSYNEILNFLDAVEKFGEEVKTVIDPLEEDNKKKTASYEAKLIKKLLLRMRE